MIVLQDAAIPRAAAISSDARSPDDRSPAVKDFAAILTDAASEEIKSDWSDSRIETPPHGGAIEVFAPVPLQSIIFFGEGQPAAATSGAVRALANATSEVPSTLASRDAPASLITLGSLPQVEAASMHSEAPLAGRVATAIKPGASQSPDQPQHARNQTAESAGLSLRTSDSIPGELQAISTELSQRLIDPRDDDTSDGSQGAGLNRLPAAEGKFGQTVINTADTRSIDIGAPELAKSTMHVEPVFMPASSISSDPSTTAQLASASAVQPALAAAQSQLSQNPGLTNTGSVMVASPAALPDTVARLVRDTDADRITIQLDPPELGRVLIDFKFDGNTLQHVSIMAETPEAVRQLRTLHAELVDALGREGFGEASMSFDERPPSGFAVAGEGPDLPRELETRALLMISPLAALKPQSRHHLSDDGRLDIRL